MYLFDLLIMGFFFAVVLLSFLGGFDKTLSILAGLYLGALAAAKLYIAFANNVLVNLFPAMESYTGELVAFLLLLLVVSVSVSIALSRNWVMKRLAQRIGVLNNLAGGLLGLMLAFLSTIITGMGIIVFLHVMNATGELGESPTISDLEFLLSESALVPMFVQLLPVALAPLMPFFPAGMPSLFASGG
jgi:hypothetical protein